MVASVTYKIIESKAKQHKHKNLWTIGSCLYNRVPVMHTLLMDYCSIPTTTTNLGSWNIMSDRLYICCL